MAEEWHIGSGAAADNQKNEKDQTKKGNIGSAFAYASIVPPMPVVTRLANDAKNITIGKRVGKGQKESCRPDGQAFQ